MALRRDVPPAGGTRSFGPKSHSANPARRAISSCPSRDSRWWMGIWEAAFSQAMAIRLAERLHGAIRSSRTSPWVTQTNPSSRKRSRRSKALASWLPAMGMRSHPAATSWSCKLSQASVPRSLSAGWWASYTSPFSTTRSNGAHKDAMDSGDTAALVVRPRWRSDKMMVEATMVGANTIGHPSSTVVGGEDKQEQAA